MISAYFFVFAIFPGFGDNKRDSNGKSSYISS